MAHDSRSGVANVLPLLHLPDNVLGMVLGQSGNLAVSCVCKRLRAVVYNDAIVAGEVIDTCLGDAFKRHSAAHAECLHPQDDMQTPLFVKFVQHFSALAQPGREHYAGMELAAGAHLGQTLPVGLLPRLGCRADREAASRCPQAVPAVRLATRRCTCSPCGACRSVRWE